MLHKQTEIFSFLYKIVISICENILYYIQKKFL